MKILDDKIIRKGLKIYLNSKRTPPKIIIDEMNVHNGNARADLVALYGNTHCFEIKSDKDTLSRLQNQIEYYDYSFDRVHVVVTNKFIHKIQDIVPNYWGVILTKYSNDKLKFSIVRNAKRNPNFEPEKALLSLWKSELLKLNSQISEINPPLRVTRERLAKKIGSEATKKEVSNGIFNALENRFSNPSQQLFFTKKSVQCDNGQ